VAECDRSGLKKGVRLVGVLSAVVFLMGAKRSQVNRESLVEVSERIQLDQTCVHDW
jgi:hypothetical protein